MKNFDDIVLEAYGYDKPFLSEDVTALFPNVARSAVYESIDASINRGFLDRYQRNVYYVPRNGVFGKTVPSANEVIERKYITDRKEVFGYYSGLTLENKVGMSTQVPAMLEVTTNKSSRRVREVEPFGGWKKIVIRKPRVDVNEDNVETLMLLDLITNRSPSSLDAYELKALRKLATQVGREKAAEYARYYPGKTAKRLLESEAYGVFA